MFVGTVSFGSLGVLGLSNEHDEEGSMAVVVKMIWTALVSIRRS
jgi:hypothetical protein